MINKSENTHLTRSEIIKSGSIYTGPELVDLVYNQISKYISNDSIIADFGSGYGAFIEKFQNCGQRCFGTEYDDLSFQLLKQEYPNIQIYHENSLLNVNRNKYGLRNDSKLIIVGNPPYNYTSSLFKKGEKGEIICDPDLVSRDFGFAFLKAYNKLKADYICVLHPLAYLIKKQNFKALGDFTNNYKLVAGTIFSSKEFKSIKKTYSEFPVVSALYIRDLNGMKYSDIEQFEFKIFRSKKSFVLSAIPTIDGKINKYPTKHKYQKDEKGLELFHEYNDDNQRPRLQFYTLRDMNALQRNTSFVEGIISNGIDVTINNLYQYAWLYFLKINFDPKSNRFLYGNLSPLYTSKLEEDEFKRAVVYYAYNNNSIIGKFLDEKKIRAMYGTNTKQYDILFDELENISNII